MYVCRPLNAAIPQLVITSKALTAQLTIFSQQQQTSLESSPTNNVFLRQLEHILALVNVTLFVCCHHVQHGCIGYAGSVSFGATRRFLLRRNTDHSDKWVCDLVSGDVLIMKGSTQQHWTHSIPKMLRVSQPRINLTFRQIVQPEH